VGTGSKSNNVDNLNTVRLDDSRQFNVQIEGISES